MKISLLTSFLFLSSCALYQDIRNADMNWTGSGKYQPKNQTETPVTAQAETQSPPAETTAAPPLRVLTSTDKLATIEISETLTIKITSGAVDYKEGHSIEFKAGGETFIVPVKPTTASNVVELSDGKKFLEKIENKKEFTVELFLKDNGAKFFTFLP